MVEVKKKRMYTISCTKELFVVNTVERIYRLGIQLENQETNIYIISVDAIIPKM
ncbi:hypothetical protein H6762_03160 [Candidatus Nomurabacteria bacterium]|nr:hypothetical protein [Candidatus Nomurabacteria bacterium]